MPQDEALRLVDFTVGGRPFGVLDLEDGQSFSKRKNTLQIRPGQRTTQASRQPGRYGGTRAVTAAEENAEIAWTCAVMGATVDEALDNANELLERIGEMAYGRFVEFRPRGATYPTFSEIRGPGVATPVYDADLLEQQNAHLIELAIPVEPLGREHRMDIVDTFDIPADAQVVETNLVSNPRAALDLTGIGSGSTGTVPARITTGVPGGYGSGVEVTGTAVATTTAIVTSFGRSGTGIGLGAHPVPPNAQVAARMLARIVSIGAGAISNLSHRMYWYKADGTASVTTFTTVQAQAAPAIGTDYDLTGIVTVPSDAAFAVSRLVATQTNPSTWVIRATAAGMFVVDAAETVVPAYFDAWSDRAKAVGAEHLSSTNLYDRSTLDDYEVLLGTGLLGSGSGALRQATTGDDKLIAHTARGHRYADAQHTVALRVGAVPGDAQNFRLVLKYLDATNYVYLRTSSGSGIHLRQVVDGVDAAALSTGASAAFAAGDVVWLRGRFEGNLATAEIWLTEPTPGSAPAGTAAESQVDARFGADVATRPFLFFTSGLDADYSVEEYRVEAYTYRNRTLPQKIELCPAIPGGAAALVDVEVTPSGGAAAPVWALLGWAERPGVQNLVWNGDFADDVNGWAVAAVTGIHAAGTSITRVADAKGSSGFAGEIVTPATSDSGASFALYGRFRKGRTYTAVIRAWAPSSTTAVKAELGLNGDAAAGAAVALTVAPQTYTVTWTPTADASAVWVALTTGAATATTVRIDNVSVYEGAAAPTLASEQQGRGGRAPFGIVPAESCDTGDLSGWSVTADANYRMGQGLKVTAAGAGTAAAQWFIDPALLAPDPFTLRELDVEVFAKVDLASTLASPKLTLSARPEAGTGFGAERYAAPFWSAGKLLSKPSSGSAFRTVRLGTLTVVCDPDRPVRWKLRLAASWAGGSSGNFGLDELYLVPVASRAAGPTGRANDSAYPKFVTSTAETTKTIRSDLSGLAARPPTNGFPDSGLGGETIEFPAGPVDVLVKLASTVPDDPTQDTSSEQKEHTATVHFAVWPRVRLLRGT